MHGSRPRTEPAMQWDSGVSGFFALNVEDAIAVDEVSAVTLTNREVVDRSHGHLTHGAVFHEALRGTGSPARAAQATQARINQIAYYDQLAQLVTDASAETSFATSALIPVRYRGFVAVTALIAVHFLAVAVVAVLFLGFTRHTLIGHNWQAVSHALSDDTLPLLGQAGGMKDGEVERWAESRSVGLRRRAVLRRGGDGRFFLSTRGSSPRGSITGLGTGR